MSTQWVRDRGLGTILLDRVTCLSFFMFFSLFLFLCSVRDRGIHCKNETGFSLACNASLKCNRLVRLVCTHATDFCLFLFLNRILLAALKSLSPKSRLAWARFGEQVVPWLRKEVWDLGKPEFMEALLAVILFPCTCQELQKKEGPARPVFLIYKSFVLFLFPPRSIWTPHPSSSNVKLISYFSEHWQSGDWFRHGFTLMWWGFYGLGAGFAHVCAFVYFSGWMYVVNPTWHFGHPTAHLISVFSVLDVVFSTLNHCWFHCVGSEPSGKRF